MSSSQQEVNNPYTNPNPLKRGATFPGANNPVKTTKGVITLKTAKQLSDLFESYYQNFLHPIQLVEQEEEQPKYLTTERTDKSGKYFYFIGRANPPHDGHIAALLSLIEHAARDNGTAIILLGSGPNGGVRTSKDPLDFDLKSRFIIAKLKEEGISPELFENGTIQIKEMDKPAEQIRSSMREDIINELYSELIQLEAIRLSGAKDGGEDVKKLAWMEKALNAGIIDQDGNLIPITASVIPVPALQIEGQSEPMSATIIRNIIYNIDSEKTETIPDNEVEFFRQNTGNFYVTTSGDYTPLIANAIYQFKPNQMQIDEDEEIQGPQGIQGTKSKKILPKKAYRDPSPKEKVTGKNPPKTTKPKTMKPKKGGSRRRTNKRRRRRTNKRRKRTNKRRRN